MTLEQLRARLKDITGANEQITKAQEAAGRLLTKDELETLGKNLAEAEEIMTQIDVLKRASAVKAASAVPAGTPVDGTGTAARPAVKQELKTTEKIGVMIQGLLKAKAEPHKHAFAHMDDAGFGEVAKEFDSFRQKVLNSSTSISGGILVPTDMSTEIIELLRPTTAFLQGNPTRVQMPNGNYTMPGAATGASASYTTEGQPSSVTEQTFREVRMNAKTLSAVIPATNDMMDFSISGAQQFIQADLVAAMSEKMDSAAFRGDGVAGNPLGIYNIPGVSAFTAVNTTTPTIAQVDADARKLINALEDASIPLASAAWVMPAWTLGYLVDLRDGNGNKAYPTLDSPNPTFKGYPVIKTTNIPTNLGGGSNETIIGFVAFRHALFGESKSLELAVSNEAALTINGTMISLFQNRMTAVLAVMQHDFNLRHVKAVAQLTAVKWGK